MRDRRCRSPQIMAMPVFCARRRMHRLLKPCPIAEWTNARSIREAKRKQGGNDRAER